jgi:putative addiction module CopG family antidote
MLLERTGRLTNLPARRPRHTVWCLRAALGVCTLPVPAPFNYHPGMDDVTLPPELERFATEAVAAGRYQSVSDVVAAGVSLLQRQEQARAELLASVQAAKEESDRDGYLTGDEVADRVRATIARRANAAA